MDVDFKYTVRFYKLRIHLLMFCAKYFIRHKYINKLSPHLIPKIQKFDQS